ncbi:CheY chemotaxis protein or a CheY-like REC (receiver) domain [Chryseolinea serpens]|uniref:CheY chemotaxis protein or a CheY-like REC (Receiver) domain n=1 Tax=Chryseolinea serpens TaxID=947013 RepID=A0A1M5MLX4_9BACT|nr:response regulator [Chryseolinea serpens]SHG78424.1 CheY chemotaxis protein or a CheY-like REC (receiver) domain [Chryseolinea serpens]
MKQLTIMVVDDDPDDIDLFKDALSEVDNSCRLIVANDGRDALQQLRGSSLDPNIIFLDYNMPFMNGVRCLATLKEDPLFKNIPVVMHSTTLPEEDIAFCKGLGAKILVKQVVFASMIRELTKILSEVRSRESVFQPVNIR